MQRRHFLALTAAAATLSTKAAAPVLRAAVIGHSGRGDFGHGMDRIFFNRPGVKLVAVADANPAGLQKAGERLGVQARYADFRTMLAEQKPDVVSVAPRHSDQHAAMAVAALETGAHVVMEKPFTVDLLEADAVLRAAEPGQLKIAVAHQMRMDPAVKKLEEAFHAGLIGDLLDMQGWGKQDQRAGGEDLIVLGTHVFDFMRMFAGDAQWCHASVFQNGHPITREDARVTRDAVGKVAGNEVVASFGFARGVVGRFMSKGRQKETTGAWGLELIGSKGSMRINANLPPRIYQAQYGPWTEAGREMSWKLWDGIPEAELVPASHAADVLNGWMVDDWLEAIRHNRPPRCSGFNAMKSLEMIHAVYHAALLGQRIAMPLRDRAHPLAG